MELELGQSIIPMYNALGMSLPCTSAHSALTLTPVNILKMLACGVLEAFQLVHELHAYVNLCMYMLIRYVCLYTCIHAYVRMFIHMYILIHNLSYTVFSFFLDTFLSFAVVDTPTSTATPVTPSTPAGPCPGKQHSHTQ